MSDSDPDIARYALIINEKDYYGAWEVLQADTEAAANPEEADRLIDCYVAAEKLAAASRPSGYIGDDGFWIPDEDPPVDDNVPVRRVPVKAPAAKRRRHLRVVGDY